MELIGKNKKRGRRAFKPTKPMRNRIEIGAAAGLSHNQLAAVLGISRPTLESNFVDELKNGRARKLLQTLCLLDKQAKRGSVAAMKYLVNAFSNGAPLQRLSPKEAKLQAAMEAIDNSPWRDLIGRVDEPEARNGQ
jgi:hypothetical protein